ncbi:MAG: general secretion pathway protein GspB [Candidatus Sedimenticola sp. 20ELBAFRAG]
MSLILEALNKSQDARQDAEVQNSVASDWLKTPPAPRSRVGAVGWGVAAALLLGAGLVTVFATGLFGNGEEAVAEQKNPQVKGPAVKEASPVAAQPEKGRPVVSKPPVGLPQVAAASNPVRAQVKPVPQGNASMAGREEAQPLPVISSESAGTVDARPLQQPMIAKRTDNQAITTGVSEQEKKPVKAVALPPVVARQLESSVKVVPKPVQRPLVAKRSIPVKPANPVTAVKVIKAEEKPMLAESTAPVMGGSGSVAQAPLPAAVASVKGNANSMNADSEPVAAAAAVRGGQQGRIGAEQSPKVEKEPEEPLLMTLPYKFQKTLPELTINVHAFSEDPASRYVILNMKRYRESDKTKEGMRVVSIRENSLVLEYGQRKFRILR